jgi:hypothetical protein
LPDVESLTRQVQDRLAAKGALVLGKAA